VPDKVRLRVRVADSEHDTEVVLGATSTTVVVAGHALEVYPVGDGLALVRDGTTQWTVVLDAEADPRQASVLGRAFSVQVQTAQALAAERARAAQRGSRSGGALTAPMPGRVIRVLAAAGATVQAGEPVLIVEAMKMENELLAPSSGVVQRVHVEVGSTVEAGQLLAEISAPSD
jgi:biotin carboxyl carrier protein